MVFYATVSHNWLVDIKEVLSHYLSNCLREQPKIDLSGFELLQGNEKHVYYIDSHTPFDIKVQGKRHLNHDAGHGAALIRIQTKKNEAVATVVRGQSFFFTDTGPLNC